MYRGVRNPQTGHMAMMAVRKPTTPARVMAGIRLGKSVSTSTERPSRKGAIVEVYVTQEMIKPKQVRHKFLKNELTF
jgi:hypothetical protein